MTAYRLAVPLISIALLAGCASGMHFSETNPNGLNTASSDASELNASSARVKPVWAGRLKTGTFHCELNNRVSVIAAENHANAINLNWKGTAYRMTPVSTTTGALRFEHSDSGLVWIQIPAKSMLLNTNEGLQLANECKLHS